MTIDKAAQILRNGQAEISAIRKQRNDEKRAWIEARYSRMSAEKTDRQARRIVVREACAHVNASGGEVLLMFHSNDIRSIVEKRGLRVRMVDGLAVIYKGA